MKRSFGEAKVGFYGSKQEIEIQDISMPKQSRDEATTESSMFRMTVGISILKLRIYILTLSITFILYIRVME